MVSFGTILPIFIDIGSYLADKEQKISWQVGTVFLRHGVHTLFTQAGSGRDNKFQ